MLLPTITSAANPTATEVEAETRAFHARRISTLTAPEGWLSVVGLLWLAEGENTVGAASDNALRCPAGWPAHLGRFVRRGNAVSMIPLTELSRAGTPVAAGPIAVELEGESAMFEAARYRFSLIRRGDRVGLRLRDPGSPARTGWRDIPRYPPAAAWRIVARFEPAPPGQTLDVPNVLGMVQPLPCPGTVVFEIGGHSYRLSPVLTGDQGLFFVFGDGTNTDATYATGRFLVTDLPRDGTVVLDFNRAINPPCAFTHFATCPLPPKQNKLAVRIEAGEQRVAH